jgi:alpha-amylase
MKSICFYFQVHQPFRLRTYRFFDIGKRNDYFDDLQNEWICRRVAEKCYLPANKLIKQLIEKTNRKFKISYSISGTALEQFELYCPDVIESFRQLAETGCVEFLSETYYHSLSSLVDENEFVFQVDKHKKKIEELFGQSPKIFRNTELIYSDDIASKVEKMGFKAQLAEGAKHVLAWRSPNYLYKNYPDRNLFLLLKNYQLSDDIAFRFSQTSWQGYPLTCDKFVSWLNQLEAPDCVNLFMDYETFGEHQWKETGIFDFLERLPFEVFENSDFDFATPSELISRYEPKDCVSSILPMSWADEERDLTAWLGNNLQNDAFEQLYELGSVVSKSKDEELLKVWRKLQTSDNFYYMCTKWFSDGDVHKYFNHYDSPYKAYINYMNVLSDLRLRLKNYL